MVTRRTPIKRMRHTYEFMPETIEAFKHLRKVYEKGGCTCPPRPDFVWPIPRWKPGDPLFEPPPPPPCAACQVYDKAFGEVVGLLNLKPWEMLENPYFENPYPSGSYAWKKLEDEKKIKNYTPGPIRGTWIRGGFAIWWRLERACGLEPLKLDGEEE